LYSISHPDKKGKLIFDLSSDNETIIENKSLAPRELAAERVITKVFSKLQTTCGHIFLANFPEWGSICEVLMVDKGLTGKMEKY